jgi:acetyl-CoA acetyltransferase
VRTPFAHYGGSLSHLRLDDLLGMTIRGACEHVGVPLEQIEDIVAGCVNVAHEGMGDVPDGPHWPPASPTVSLPP